MFSVGILAPCSLARSIMVCGRVAYNKCEINRGDVRENYIHPSKCLCSSTLGKRLSALWLKNTCSLISLAIL